MNEEEQRKIEIIGSIGVGEKSVVVDGTSSGCNSIPCGYSLGDPWRRARMKEEWEEYRRGWSGL